MAAAPPRPATESHGRYVKSLEGRDLEIYLFGERVADVAAEPVLRPSVNAVAETYRLAESEPELATAHSELIDARVNRFAHICTSAKDVAAQNEMQRRLGQRTGTCFQRCVGQDALNASWATTFRTDAAHGTPYVRRADSFSHESRRRRGWDADSPRRRDAAILRRIAAPPRLGRG